MADLRFLILGDDFAPAALFKDSIVEALSGLDVSVSFRCVDTEPDELSAVHSDEIAEAFGDSAEVAALARDCHVIVTTFAPVTKRVLEETPDLLAIACGRGGPRSGVPPFATRACTEITSECCNRSSRDTATMPNAASSEASA